MYNDSFIGLHPLGGKAYVNASFTTRSLAGISRPKTCLVNVSKVKKGVVNSEVFIVKISI